MGYDQGIAAGHYGAYIGTMSTGASQSAGGQSRAQDVTIVEVVEPEHASTTLLLDEMLADLIASGEFVSTSCEALGIDVRKLYKRLKVEPTLAAMLDDAHAAGMSLRAARTARIARGDVSAGSSGDWKRDQLIIKQENWLLEKLHPEQYGNKLEVKTKSLNANVPMSDDPIEAARQYEELMGRG